MAIPFISSSAVALIQDLLLNLVSFITANITPATITNQQSLLQVIQQTLINSLSIVDGYSLQVILNQENALLQDATTGSVAISASDLSYITNRTAALTTFTKNVYTLPTTLTFNINNLNSNQPAIQSYDLTGFLTQFVGETAPSSFISIQSNAQSASTAWSDLLTYLPINGTPIQILGINAVDRMQQAANDVSTILNNITVSASISNSTAWNALVAVPTILRFASISLNDPSSQPSQTYNCLKYLIQSLLKQVNLLLTSFAIPNVTRAQTAELRAGESLIDFAARTTGNLENWPTIATLNGLAPPYVGNTPAPTIATPGQNLYLPSSVGLISGVPLSDYLTKFLGTDLNFGPVGTPINVWGPAAAKDVGADFNLVRGFTNLQYSLARRVLTPLGSLIYHNNYGSLLPAQVGNISTSSTAQFLATFLKRALIADPRVQVVTKISALAGAHEQIILRATVVPTGSTQSGTVGLVLIPEQRIAPTQSAFPPPTQSLALPRS